MATVDELGKITRALNVVKTGAQARAAVGAALTAIGRSYPLLSRLSSDVAKGPRRELDNARIALEAWYPKIPSGSAAYANEWAKKRGLVSQAYVVVAGVEGAADYSPLTSWAQILEESVQEGLANVGNAAGQVTAAAGKAAGSAVGGVFSGLGITGLVTIAIVLVVVVAIRRRLLGGLL